MSYRPCRNHHQPESDPPSTSLGLSAVFLIGGLTRDTKPFPILLRSGDVIIMSGPHCRRAYHGESAFVWILLPLHMLISTSRISRRRAANTGGDASSASRATHNIHGQGSGKLSIKNTFLWRATHRTRGLVTFCSVYGYHQDQC